MRMRTALALLAALSFGGCHGKAEQARSLTVENAWIRLSPNPANPSAAYFTIHGGAAEEQLTGVTSPQAAHAEMHETMSGDHGMATMAPLSQVAVPAGGTLVFAPAGRHVMLFGLDPAATAGREVRLDFAFASGRGLAAKARVRAIGDDGE